MSHGYWTYVLFQIGYLTLGSITAYFIIKKLDIIISLLDK